MKITDAMLAEAIKAAPGVSAEQVRAIFGSLKAGQIVFNTGEGHTLVDGKSKWPSLLQVTISDPLMALHTAQQLIAGTMPSVATNQHQTSITLLFAGQAKASE